MLDSNDVNYQPTFSARWGKESADITALVVQTMEDYAKEVMSEVELFELDAGEIQSFIFVGGGLLFGYTEFRKLDSQFYIFPDDKEKSAAITSNSYLMRNYLTRLNILKKQEDTVNA
ncbi:hypothetical protein QTG56_23085 (plasmid) [Rossellomorea sp. AcN35-11]|nr:hypothetical protein QTG56_23085 [Rossellomorea sp. AcN35-11]